MRFLSAFLLLSCVRVDFASLRFDPPACASQVHPVAWRLMSRSAPWFPKLSLFSRNSSGDRGRPDNASRTRRDNISVGYSSSSERTLGPLPFWGCIACHRPLLGNIIGETSLPGPQPVGGAGSTDDAKISSVDFRPDPQSIDRGEVARKRPRLWYTAGPTSLTPCCPAPLPANASVAACPSPARVPPPPASPVVSKVTLAPARVVGCRHGIPGWFAWDTVILVGARGLVGR